MRQYVAQDRDASGRERGAHNATLGGPRCAVETRKQSGNGDRRPRRLPRDKPTESRRCPPPFGGRWAHRRRSGPLRRSRPPLAADRSRLGRVERACASAHPSLLRRSRRRSVGRRHQPCAALPRATPRQHGVHRPAHRHERSNDDCLSPLVDSISFAAQSAMVSQCDENRSNRPWAVSATTVARACRPRHCGGMTSGDWDRRRRARCRRRHRVEGHRFGL
ncbi:UNVERIFIED_CONTAM: hypothetical protein GTU68_031215 [Idotea baltica]|nr:hypothetical protein [Idotea baltica]